MKFFKKNLSNILNLLLITIVVIGFLIYFRFDTTIGYIKKNLFQVHVENVHNIAKNVDKYFNEMLPNFSYEKLANDLELQNTISYQVIADGTTYAEYEFGDSFEPLSEEWNKTLETQKENHFKNGSNGVWFTYQYPIFQNNKMVAIFTINFSIENYYNIENTLKALEVFFKDYSFVMLIFFIFLIFVAMIHFFIDKQRVDLINKLKEETTKVNRLNKLMEKKISLRTFELQNAKNKMQKYIDIVDKYVIVTTTNLQGEIIYASEAFYNLSGYTQDEVIGQTHRIVKNKDFDVSVYENLWETITSGKS